MLKRLSFNYFGMVGKKEIIWHDINEDTQVNITEGIITYASFYHRPLVIMPSFLSALYDRCKKKKTHSASHSFVILRIIALDNEVIYLQIDFDGSMHIRPAPEVEDDWRATLRNDVNDISFDKFMLELTQDGLPDYDHAESNCKHFMEKVADILFPNNKYKGKYLAYMHRNRKITSAPKLYKPR